MTWLNPVTIYLYFGVQRRVVIPQVVKHIWRIVWFHSNFFVACLTLRQAVFHNYTLAKKIPPGDFKRFFGGNSSSSSMLFLLWNWDASVCNCMDQKQSNTSGDTPCPLCLLISPMGPIQSARMGFLYGSYVTEIIWVPDNLPSSSPCPLGTHAAPLWPIWGPHVHISWVVCTFPLCSYKRNVCPWMVQDFKIRHNGTK